MINTILGAIAGGMPDKSSSQVDLRMTGPSELETQLGKDNLSSWNSFRDALNAGPGQEYIGKATGAQDDLAEMFKKFAAGGFMPGQQDISSANSLAQQLFAPQQTQLNQQFEQQQIMGNRQMAKMGRGPGDPIMMNKLAQEQTRQQSMLNSQMGSYATQYAQQMPQMRLGYQQDYAGVMSGLASQAMQNRQALLSMGSNLQSQERNWRLGSASREQTGFQGGGIKGSITGGLAGMGTDMRSAAQMMSMFSGNPMAAAGGGGGGGSTGGGPAMGGSGRFNTMQSGY